jgi:hypothetical protein
VAEHDGYAWRGVLHRRTVIFDKPHWVVVIDDLMPVQTSKDTTPDTSMAASNTDKAGHCIEQWWHFPLGSRIESMTPVGGQGDGELVGEWVVCGDARFAFVRVEMPEIDVKRAYGLESPIQGWLSPRYGHLSPAPALGFGCQATLPTRMVVAFCLNPTATAQEIEAACLGLRTRVRFFEEQVQL